MLPPVILYRMPMLAVFLGKIWYLDCFYKVFLRIVCASNYLVSWTDFGTRVCQTRLWTGKQTLLWPFFSAYSRVYRKRHYRVHIVALLTNATKKNATIG